MLRKDQWCKVLNHEKMGPEVYLICLESKEIALGARPGQFVMISVNRGDSKDPLLRRPFSIAWTDESRDAFYILYRVVGRGTSILSKIKNGEFLKVLGPLGNGFNTIWDEQRFLVGGGLGIAPIIFLAKKMQSKQAPHKCIIGIRSKEDFPALIDILQKDITHIEITSEDGSVGIKGLVTTALESLVKNHRNCLIQTCGPIPMLKAISEIVTRYGIKWELSLEANMACGVGLCLGCAFEGKNRIVHICKDGPVFDGNEIFA
ncbi:Dihydroorotate dehydrogenase electron transfer subunit [Dissulfuribacter thermophilus]|uniref:Dihydroorotate dehydrogenase electron transfer subunit n=1 Tax=Dissulfuribacter thermophilus TaxID=1156395 RepID=A0A1B9F6H4_9BACT|nr:dihydroorotate dehydrogenase electron transfer subunit [Dissulfuribacter thermophilus]OCC15483.1 Dihydroorotate dehydrogenase electron transfer subunit [Dissulfuribacter thermophilus]